MFIFLETFFQENTVNRKKDNFLLFKFIYKNKATKKKAGKNYRKIDFKLKYYFFKKKTLIQLKKTPVNIDEFKYLNLKFKSVKISNFLPKNRIFNIYFFNMKFLSFKNKFLILEFFKKNLKNYPKKIKKLPSVKILRNFFLKHRFNILLLM